MTTPFLPSSSKPCASWGLRPSEDSHQLSPLRDQPPSAEVREEPRHDFDIVPGATLDDFEPTALKRLLRSRPRPPHTPLRLPEPPRASKGTGAIRPDGAVRRPTLAGLLAAGRKPPAVLSSLQIVFARWAGTLETRSAFAPKSSRARSPTYCLMLSTRCASNMSGSRDHHGGRSAGTIRTTQPRPSSKR